jgi:acyl-CoA thioester hydrolase
MWRFEYEVDVRYNDCDPMGHVNNAVYLTYLEAARFAWWRTTFASTGQSSHGFVVARVEIDYRRQAFPGERLIVRLRVDGISRSSFTVAYEILNGRTRETIAEGKSVQVAYDATTGKSVPLSDDVRAKLEAAL